MKTMKTLFLIILVAAFGISVAGQEHNHSMMNSAKTETFKVMGNCEMCKTRIEKAAKVEGISKAEWNSGTKLLSLTYDPSKVKPDDILKKIAAVGHDNEKYKAEQSVYDQLPGCCKYR
jgi:copper chaperone CopZ